MDSGAYGSYPAYTQRRRRRYNYGRYITNKYGSTRAYARKRNYVAPVNQFTYKKTRIGKYTKTQLTSLKCTYTDNIAISAGTNTMIFSSTVNQWQNINAMLQASPEWVSRSTQFSYYMINGISVTYTRKWIDPIAYGVNGTSSGFLASDYQVGMAALSTNFYPNLTSTTVGQPVEDADSSWLTSPFIHGRQSHYQPFPKNFTTGTNSNGLGVWNACSQISNLSGELAIYAPNQASVSDVAQVSIFDVEINFYVSFCNNTGT